MRTGRSHTAGCAVSLCPDAPSRDAPVCGNVPLSSVIIIFLNLFLPFSEEAFRVRENVWQ